MTTNSINSLKLDLAYFQRKVEGRLPNERERYQIDLLEDAIVVYRLRHKLRQGDKYQHIPASLLVQTFMRKLQDDVDRRRP
jgi:hypothetical protein